MFPHLVLKSWSWIFAFTVKQVTSLILIIEIESFFFLINKSKNLEFLEL